MHIRTSWGVITRHLRIRSRWSAIITLPAIPARWRRWHRLLHLSAFVAADATSEDGEEEQGTDDGDDGDYDCLVVVDPGLDFAAEGCAFALAVFASTTSAARCAI